MPHIVENWTPRTSAEAHERMKGAADLDIIIMDPATDGGFFVVTARGVVRASDRKTAQLIARAFVSVEEQVLARASAAHAGMVSK